MSLNSNPREKNKKRRRTNSTGAAGPTVHGNDGDGEPKEKISRAPKLNAKFIADTHAERVRAGREGHSFTVIDIGEKKVCQLCARAERKENGERNQNRAQITCDNCRVHLCLYCWMDWHSDRLT